MRLGLAVRVRECEPAEPSPPAVTAASYATRSAIHSRHSSIGARDPAVVAALLPAREALIERVEPAVAEPLGERAAD